MKISHVRIAVFGFFILYALAVTWPGAVPFNRARPFILGLPFTMAWAVLWIVLGCVALWILDWSETRARPDGGPEGAARVAHRAAAEGGHPVREAAPGQRRRGHDADSDRAAGATLPPRRCTPSTLGE
ncbi:MAG: hypothetical protein R6W86_15990 [Marinobacter sp.]|uniref:hypothetical protein n=1 Tax=Marinobacter sp. TaxID=50741 RepID=UPI00396F218F